jgi:Sortase domain
VTLLARAGSRLAIVMIAVVLLAGSASAARAHPPRGFLPIAVSSAPAANPIHVIPAPAPRPAVRELDVPAALTDRGLDLRSGPIAVPLLLQIPSIGVSVTVIGVGMTSKAVMDAPMGRADDPVWQQAFWYRGSAVPGALSTALFAAHVDDPLGRPAAFARIGRLRPGAVIIVRDTRNGLDVRFAVTGTHSYPLSETTDPAVLERMYGTGPVAGTGPQRSSDDLAHLTLVTCAGTFQNAIGTHDRRLAVYAIRVG